MPRILQTQISVTGATYEALRIAADERGTSIAGLTEQIVNDAIDAADGFCAGECGRTDPGPRDEHGCCVECSVVGVGGLEPTAGEGAP